MGEMNDRIRDALAAENKGARPADLMVFADALALYFEAQENIRRNGAIVKHPRTGSAIENPYMKVQIAQGKVLSSLRWIKSTAALALLESTHTPQSPKLP